MDQKNLNNAKANTTNDQEKNARLRQIYKNFLVKVKELRTSFNTKIFGIVKTRDEQKEEELRNKIKQM